MKFARLGPVGREVPALLLEGRYFDVSSLTSDIDGQFLSSERMADADRAARQGALPEIADAGSLRIGAPIARPGAVICIGMNYAAHAAESGSAPPAVPIMFLKTPNTVVGPNDTVTIPRGSTKTDWEVELGVVIGQHTSYLDSPADSIKHIAGFVTANDLSERDFQLTESGGQWSKGKCAPGFNPTGPWLVTPDEVDYQSLGLRSWVNGEARQASCTADQLFGVDFIIWHLSQYLAMEPGDLILTGTPEGVGLSGRFPYLAAGDICEIEIDGLGRQRQEFVAANEKGQHA
jgi:2,4-diketo-3-deoxy-L-fuconate hydrolase